VVEREKGPRISGAGTEAFFVEGRKFRLGGGLYLMEGRNFLDFFNKKNASLLNRKRKWGVGRWEGRRLSFLTTKKKGGKRNSFTGKRGKEVKRNLSPIHQRTTGLYRQGKVHGRS